MTKIKICGIKTRDALKAAIQEKADFIGFVFYKESSRYIDPDLAHDLTNAVPSVMTNVGLFVDPSDHEIDHVLARADLDMIQLHGTESVARVRDIRMRWGMPVIKAIAIGSEADLDQAQPYEKAADWLLFDAKISGSPGGTGQSFDWKILEKRFIDLPWMLAGGLHAGNVGAVLKCLRPGAVDISSGVENAPGCKDPQKIKEFIAAVRQSG